MKITISGEDFNRIMRVCTPSLARMDSAHDGLKYIEVRGKNGKAVATACNSFHLAQCPFAYQGDKEIRFMLPRHKPVKKNATMTITIENGAISIADGEETVSRQAIRVYDVAEIVDSCKSIQGDTRLIGVSRKHLRRLLESYGTEDILVLEVPENQNAPVAIHSAHTYGLVMPERFKAASMFASEGLATTKGAAK